MKRTVRLSLRLLSIVLALMMCVGLLPSAAYAAVLEDDPVGENGSSDTYAYVAVSDGFTYKYPYRVKTGAASVLDGTASYDLATNTLTLNNFHGASIETNKMGEDFTIRLVGSNSATGGLSVWGDAWGGSANITGDGSLTVSGITLNAETAPAVLNIGADARVTATNTGIMVYNSASENPIRFEGKERSHGKAGKTRNTTPALHPSYDLSSTSYGEKIYYNPTMPYRQYSKYADTVYFAVRRSVHTSATRAKDKKTMKAVSFTLRDVKYENDMYVWYSTITQIYIWEDSALYQQYKDDLSDLTLEAYDPNYQEVTEESFNDDEWSIVNNLGESLAQVDIVPQSADITFYPEMEAADFEDALMGRFYTAKLNANAMNGGSITDYKLSGSASSWLRIDSKGNLSGKPKAAGMYSFFVSAVETVGSQTLESLPMRYRIFVKEPDNMLQFTSTVDDGAAHTLTFTSKSGGYTKTMDIGNTIIGEGRAFSLDGILSGDYTMTFTATLNGAVITYANPTKEITLAEGENNTVSFNPGAATVTPDENSILLKVNNLSLLKDYNTVLLWTTDDGKEHFRSVDKEVTLFPDLLDGKAIASSGLYVYDDAYRLISSGGEVQADGNSLTVSAVSPDITEYTVTGVPDVISQARLSINNKDSFTYYKPANSWETETFRLGTLNDSDKLSVINRSGSEDMYMTYDLDVPPSVTVSGNDIQVGFTEFSRDGVLRGKVLGADNQPVAGASVTCSQLLNGKTQTVTVLSGADGSYRIESLVSGRKADLSISAENFLDSTDSVDSVSADTEHDLRPDPCGYIRLITDRPVTNAHITWSGAGQYIKGLFSQNGSSFMLPVSADANGEMHVSLKSYKTVGTAYGTVTVENGSGTLNLETEGKGCLNWSGYLADGSFIADYSNKLINIQSDDNRSYTFYTSTDSSIWLIPGKYTVTFKDRFNELTYGHQEIEVKEDETSYVSVQLTDKPEKLVSGSLTAPKSATTGEVYKVEGVINEFDDLYGLHFFVGEFSDWDSGVKGVIINGKAAGINHNYVEKRQNPHVDWSFPLHFTFYCEQRATADTRSQTFFVQAAKSTNGYAATDHYLLDAVTTAYAPNVTLNTAEAVGGVKASDSKDYVTYTPEPVPFSGKTLPNTYVTIYDNDEVFARVLSDGSGNYKGSVQLKSSDPVHTIRASVTYDGKTYSAKNVCYYRPGGAVLKRLWMNGNEYSIGGFTRGYTTGILGGSFWFSAAIDNPDQLDDITYSIDGADVTGKVFFMITTVEGARIFKAEPNNNMTRWYTTYQEFSNVYPTGIKVLYRSKEADHSYTDTFTDADGSESSLNVGMGVKRTNGGTSGGEYNGSFKPNEWIKAVLDGYNGEDPEAVGAKDDEEEEPITSEMLYDATVWKLNHGEGDGKFKTLTAEQAAAKVSGGKAEIRTYTDSPQWEVTDQNLHLRMVELQQKGYQSYSYFDEETGHKMYAFSGTFYYAKDATPVPSLQIQKIYSGIVKTEDDPRMFHDGKMIGSTLEVNYICDVTAKKWYRTQTATMPAGVRSAIHTSSYQIPSKSEAPFSYKDTNVFPAGESDSSSGSSAVGAKVGSDLGKQGISFEIDFSRVSGKTYTSGAISLGGFAYGKMAKATYFRSTDKMYVLNRQTDELMDLVDIGLDSAINKGKNTMYIGVSKESLTSAGVVYSLGKVNDAVNKPKDLNDVYDKIYYQLRDNMRYYGKVKSVAKYTEENGNAGVIGDFSLDKYDADRMLQKTRKMADAVVELQKAIENAGHQDEFTKTVTEQMGYLSLGASLCPGIGTEASLVIDSLSFIISAANDTRNSKVREAAEKLLDEYRDYLKEDQRVKDKLDEEEERVENYQKMGFKVKTRSQIAEEDLRKKRGTSGGGGGSVDTGDGGGGTEPGGDTGTVDGGTPPDVDVSVTPAHDPSGKVYEAVLSNTVEGATVTLYKYESTQSPMSRWDDSNNLGQDNPLTSDEEGYYRWDVPEGEWYVTAEKDGYVSGSSQNDTAATVAHNGVNYLPVLPPQLDVNIPLVSTASPTVESITAKEDGVYITFSKYMDESTVIPENFELLSEDKSPIAFTLEKLDSEQAPSNIRYSGDAPCYTRTVRLSANLELNKEFGVKVSEKLTSYAGVPMLSEYSDEVYSEEKRTLTAPTFSVEPGEVEKNTVVTLKAPEGASIIYTTDGSEPNAENGKKVKNGAGVAITSDVTIKAIAVQLDAVTSAVAKAEYKVIVHVDTTEYEPDFIYGDVNEDGDVDVNDVTLIQKHAASLIELEGTALKAADVTHDGGIDINDATRIQKYIAGLIDNLDT